MKLTRPAWMEVDLDKLSNNIAEIRKHIEENSQIMAVVKSDAYSFGIIKIVEELRANGIKFFAVATTSEALKIRKHYVNVDILVLGYTPEYLMSDSIDQEIVMTVYNLNTAIELDKIASIRNQTARIHLAVDTGMNRIGFKPTEDSYRDIEKINELKNVKIEGIFSHFADADSNEEYTRLQFSKFMEFINEIELRGIDPGVRHINNSTGILKYREYSLDYVRPGIIQYGSKEGVESSCGDFFVEYIAQIKAEISNLKTINEGEKVGYGLTFEADRETKVATLPIGYADGIIRQLSGKIDVLVDGKRCPQIGRICMDQMMIDVSDVDCSVGDEVVILGKQGNEEITICELASKADEIATSFSCHFSPRLPRVYKKDGEIESIHDLNLE